LSEWKQAGQRPQGVGRVAVVDEDPHRFNAMAVVGATDDAAFGFQWQRGIGCDARLQRRMVGDGDGDGAGSRVMVSVGIRTCFVAAVAAGIGGARWPV
jgi:hypothetical protein